MEPFASPPAESSAPAARPNAAHAVPARRSIGRRGKWIGALLALAVLAGVGILAWTLTHPAAGTTAARPGGARGGPPATTVGVATVATADIPVILEALGTVTPAATVTVRPQASGVLEAVHFREGQTVRAGQLLATIDPRQFEMALQQASGQRQRDEAQLENAKLTLERFRTLLTQDSIARQDVDTQAALVKQLEGTVVTDRANEGTARLNLGYTRILAPITGRVGLRVVDAGNLVSAGDSAGIAVITQLAPIDVEFAVPQDFVPEVHARSEGGAKLPVTAFDRTRTTELASGTFATLDNQVDTQTGTVRAKARFANDKATLFPSQFVNVRLLLRTIPDALVIPVTALRHGNDGDFVYVLDPATSTVAQRPVTRGQATADRVAITTGLKAGEQVITEGADRLKDGARVTLPGAAPAPEGARVPVGTGAKAGAEGSQSRPRRGPAADGAPANEGTTDATGNVPAAAPAAAAPGPGDARGTAARPPRTP